MREWLMPAIVLVAPPATHMMPELLHNESRYELPLTPPLRRRATTIDIENPIVMIHAEVEAVLRTRLAGAHATLP